jgi:hypothetical protein
VSGPAPAGCNHATAYLIGGSAGTAFRGGNTTAANAGGGGCGYYGGGGPNGVGGGGSSWANTSLVSNITNTAGSRLTSGGGVSAGQGATFCKNGNSGQGTIIWQP